MIFSQPKLPTYLPIYTIQGRRSRLKSTSATSRPQSLLFGYNYFKANFYSIALRGGKETTSAMARWHWQVRCPWYYTYLLPSMWSIKELLTSNCRVLENVKIGKNQHNSSGVSLHKRMCQNAENDLFLDSFPFIWTQKLHKVIRKSILFEIRIEIIYKQNLLMSFLFTQ